MGRQTFDLRGKTAFNNLRSLLQPLSELGLRRDRRFLETLRPAEAEESQLTTPQPPR